MDWPVQRDGSQKQVESAYSRTSGECAYTTLESVVGLIVLTIQTVWLSSTLLSVEKSLALAF
jgi:hypothetical protein